MNNDTWLREIKERYLNKHELGESEKLSIGKISNITDISVRSIRHYCDIGLVKPTFIDNWTNYRYFSTDQITKILLIKDMRELGFSLKEISLVMNNDNLSDRISLIDEKVDAIHSEIEILKQKEHKLTKLVREFRLMSNITSKEISFIIKNIPKKYYYIDYSNNEKIDGLAYMNAFKKIDKLISQSRYSSEEKYVSFLSSLSTNTIENKKMKYGVEINVIKEDDVEDDIKSGKVMIASAGEYATMTYRGDYSMLYSDGYQKMLMWLRESGRKFCDEAIEIYHITRPFDEVTMNPLTEIQVKLL